MATGEAKYKQNINSWSGVVRVYLDFCGMESLLGSSSLILFLDK